MVQNFEKQYLDHYLHISFDPMSPSVAVETNIKDIVELGDKINMLATLVIDLTVKSRVDQWHQYASKPDTISTGD